MHAQLDLMRRSVFFKGHRFGVGGARKGLGCTVRDLMACKLTERKDAARKKERQAFFIEFQQRGRLRRCWGVFIWRAYVWGGKGLEGLVSVEDEELKDNAWLCTRRWPCTYMDRRQAP